MWFFPFTPAFFFCGDSWRRTPTSHWGWQRRAQTWLGTSPWGRACRTLSQGCRSGSCRWCSRWWCSGSFCSWGLPHICLCVSRRIHPPGRSSWCCSCGRTISSWMCRQSSRCSARWFLCPPWWSWLCRWQILLSCTVWHWPGWGHSLLLLIWQLH